jgi:hypothetical protein
VSVALRIKDGNTGESSRSSRSREVELSARPREPD